MNDENDDYLWDRSGTPDPDVERLERKLASLAQQNPPPRLLLSDRRMGKRPVRAYAALATAAAILIGVLLGGTALVRRMNSQVWDVTRAGGNPTISSRPVGAGARLSVGGWLENGRTFDGRASMSARLAGSASSPARGFVSSAHAAAIIVCNSNGDAARHDLGSAGAVLGRNRFVHGRRFGVCLHAHDGR